MRESEEHGAVRGALFCEMLPGSHEWQQLCFLVGREPLFECLQCFALQYLDAKAIQCRKS